MESIENLQRQLKKVIIEALNLEDYTVDDIITEEPLFGDGLGLDSIDALELGIAIKKEFSLTNLDVEHDIKEHFFSVEKLASYIFSLKSSEHLDSGKEV